MAITLLPNPPLRSSPANFASEAETFLNALPPFAVEANALATDVNSKQTMAASSATDAANSATASATSATASANSATASATSATASANSASSALNAPGTNATSTTSNTLGTGSKTFTIQTGKAFAVGQRMVVANTALPLNNMSGVITAHNSGTGSITLEVDFTAGSGTYTAWTLSLSPSGGVFSVNGMQGVVSGVATLNDVQTLTNKTLTSPVINENVQVISTNTNAVAGRSYVLLSSLVLTLPSAPAVGNQINISNQSGGFTCVVGSNGNNIMSLAEDLTINKLNSSFTLLYADATRGWIII